MSEWRSRRAKRELDKKIEPEQRTQLKGVDLFEDPVDNDLYIDANRLNEELMDQSLRYSKWVRLKAEASYKVKAIKNQLKVTEATVRCDLRQNAKGLRVADVDAEIDKDENIVNLRTQLIEAEKYFELYEGFVRGFSQRADMLKDLCANRRKELID